MAVIGERVERNVAHHADIELRILDRAHSARHQVVGIYGFRSLCVFEGWIGCRKYGDDRNAEFRRLAGFVDQCINRMPLDTGQGRDVEPGFRRVVNEGRPDEIRRREDVLRDKAAIPVVPPVSPHTGDREFPEAVIAACHCTTSYTAASA